jgi:hypothetical protein
MEWRDFASGGQSCRLPSGNVPSEQKLATINFQGGRFEVAGWTSNVGADAWIGDGTT